MFEIEEKKSKNFQIKTNVSFKEVCDTLDEREEKYLSWKSKTYSLLEVWKKLKKRKDIEKEILISY